MVAAVAGISPRAQTQLPPPVAEELLRRYADILRVGRLTVNGRVTAWDTDTSTEFQLRGFCESLGRRLRDLLPDFAKKDPASLTLASFWLCKAVSINYVLIEVLLLIRQRLGMFCTIEIVFNCQR
eukprot:TRINITY_DN11733_c0_g1_i3.p1 TRINITY_DN11733_c0_g1~~TRINITY_DN11733_c0_g1_i3.p1  ORF type:complete len:125 (+),score=19.83 TRINITY_DN11733_c0_g1_i3:151-525(+)